MAVQEQQFSNNSCRKCYFQQGQEETNKDLYYMAQKCLSFLVRNVISNKINF